MPFNFDQFAASPWTNIGLGILAHNTPGASFSQAVGGGGLLGLKNYQMMQQLKQKQMLEQLQVQQEQQKLDLLQNKAPDTTGNMYWTGTEWKPIPGWMSSTSGNNGPTYFGNVNYDDKGNAYLTNNAGGVKKIELPGGGRLVRPSQQANTGPVIYMVDPSTGAPRTGYQVGLKPNQTPEYLQGAEEAKLRGKGEISPKEQQHNARGRVDSVIGDMADLYGQLNDLNAIVNTEKSPGENISASVQSSSVGQAVGTVLGSKAQSIRNQINMKKPLLISMIRQATGMSARAMDSDRELTFYLQAATDEKRDLQSNLAAIKILSDTYGLGADIKVSPGALKAMRDQGAKVKGGKKSSPGEVVNWNDM